MLLRIANFIPLCSEDTFGVILNFENLLRLLSWPRIWSLSVNLPCEVEEKWILQLLHILFYVKQLQVVASVVQVFVSFLAFCLVILSSTERKVLKSSMIAELSISAFNCAHFFPSCNVRLVIRREQVYDCCLPDKLPFISIECPFYVQ